jgi:DnaJ-class molecular chaperone
MSHNFHERRPAKGHTVNHRRRLAKGFIYCPRCLGDKNAVLDSHPCGMCNGSGSIKRSDLDPKVLQTLAKTHHV